MSFKKSTDPRQDEIHKWLKIVLPSSEYQMEPASNDASFRRYFRVYQDSASWIVMDAPPSQEDTGPFVKIAAFLLSTGINVPQIVAQQVQLGFLLLSDLGHTQYLAKLNNRSANQLYQSAIDELIQIQQSNIGNITLPNYDAALLEQEMSLFPEWFLSKHLDVEPPKILNDIYQLLIESALEQPSVFVHRDFHSRNLMYLENAKPGIIDFQDAVVGPISYDLVSLLRDCYISWSEQQLSDWISYYYSRAQQQGLLPNISIAQFTRWFDLMGLQRHLKILGIFCRLNYRDNKPNYLNDLPLTLHYVKKITAKYNELADLSHFLDHPKIAAISAELAF
ncbi:MAG: aminoglycoside phosphotransferase [Methylophaga sp.]|nr:MAG: aminoglycoside phosphotransferase [Methylophaga sp.]